MVSSEYWFGARGFYNDVATQSLRFDSGSSARLEKTPSASNRVTWTWSAWVKRSKIGVERAIWSAGSSSGFALFFHSNDQLRCWTQGGNGAIYTNAVFRDTSAWYHIALTAKSSGNYFELYINGVKETSFSFDGRSTNPGGNDTEVNSNAIHYLGAWNNGGLQYFDGYLADVHFIDGTCVGDTGGILDEFIEIKNGVCIPKAYSGSYGTNGYRLEFKQTGVGSGSSSTIGADTSGNDNHYTSSGIVASDCDMPDSPENNFATLNVLDPFSGTISEGNLKYNNGASFRASRGTFAIPSSGKWYFEVLNTTLTSGSVAIWAGVASQDTNISAQPNNGSTTGFYGIYNDTSLGILSNGSQSSSTSNTISANSILQFAIDADNNKLFVGINNSYYSNATTTNGDPSAGTNPTESIDLAGYRPFVGAYNNTGVLNTGQDSTFAGTISAGGNTDANGIGDFKYAPPSGFLALCTANLPEPTISPNQTTQADDYFNTVLYTGTGTTNAITGVGFQPDWVWAKDRGAVVHHTLTDSSRGVHYDLFSSSTSQQSNDTNGLTAFDSDGFSLGSSTNHNVSSNTYVAWNWKANGGTTSSNTDGSITSTVQANTTAGFSVVTYTGNSTSEATVGHGLNAIPDWLIIKNRDKNLNWGIWHSSIGDSEILRFTNGSVTTPATPYFEPQNNTSSVFSLGVNDETNYSGDDYVAYCFAEIEGYSKFSSYTGNGSADGTFIYTGFRPAWLMVKRSSTTGNWVIMDNTRRTYNFNNTLLYPNDAQTENTNDGYNGTDFVSNGFKIRGGSSGVGTDVSGTGTYIYMAFAENPFKYSNAR